jgi:Putative beta-barrel porin-2, OmpL-like. bbp2
MSNRAESVAHLKDTKTISMNNCAVRILVFILFPMLATAQPDSTWFGKPTIALEGYADVFYSYDFNEPVTDYRQPFFYHHNRHNEFNLNHGYLKLSAAHARYRANVALHAGTYVSDNYAAEPDALQSIYEANVGLSLNNAGTVWIDVGIISSHIGFESALSIDNWTLTRSLLAENSPYYMAGAKVTWSPNSKWEMAFLVCNGWQHIRRIQGNSLPSVGTQVKFMPNTKVTLNYSTFIGSEFPDSLRRMRYFNNLYGQFQLNDRFACILGFDYGMQQQSKGDSEYDVWLSPVGILKYTINEKWTAAFRAEYYEDETGIIIPVSTPNGFKTSGLSLNLDFRPLPNLAWRVEGRWLQSEDDIFYHEENPASTNLFFTTSLAVKFGAKVQ